jgi:uncharacterized protein DUF4337
MNIEEVKEGAEHAHEKGERTIGLTMAITAVLLAMATLASHRAHTEEVLLQGKINDDWGFYQAKHARAYQFATAADLAALNPNGKDVALKDYKKSVEEECGVPPEQGCSGPQKPSSALQALLGESSEPAEKNENPEKAASSDKAEHAGGEKKSGEKQEKKEGTGKPGAAQLQDQARERQHEQAKIQTQANFYDMSELFLEISIVLCSISLLTESRHYWRMSLAVTVTGIAVALFGLLGVH